MFRLHVASLAVILSCSLWGCSAAKPNPEQSGTGLTCRADDLPGCEKALLGADAKAMAALLPRYADARDDDRWLALWRALAQDGDDAALWIGEGAPAGVPSTPLPSDPVSVEPARVLLAVAAATTTKQLFVARDGKVAQLFVDDPLAPMMLELTPVVANTAKRMAADIFLGAAVDAMLRSAGAMDYAAAATHAEKVRALLGDRRDEAAMRARLALDQLDTAGILLTPDDDAEDEQPATYAAPGSSAYADFLAVLLSRPDTKSIWAERRARILERLSPDRRRLLDAMFGQTEQCAKSHVPPMERPGDLTFVHLLGGALDASGIPGETPPDGKLSIDAWLPLYDRAVQLVETTGTAWLYMTNLLSQRGELFGLSAKGSQTHKKVSALASKHVAALSALATAHPGRFQTWGIVAMVYQSGVLNDPPLRQASTKLVQRSVALKIASASDVSVLWEAAIAAFAVGMSYPAAMQGPHFLALRQGLSTKLGGSFGKRGGWGIAALRGASAVLGMLLGQGVVGSDAERLLADLSKPDIEQPGLAKLVAAIARYVTLSGAGKLNADVSNPKLYSDERNSARAALQRAVVGLADGGAATPPQKQLLEHVVDLGDGVIAAFTARYGEQDDAPQCGGQSAISDEHHLRDAFDRLHKKRRALLALPAFSGDREQGEWVDRARLLAVVLSDALDMVDQRGGELRFAVDEAAAQRIVDRAVGGWTDHAWGDVARSGYLLLRSGFGAESSDPKYIADNALNALRALSKLFGDEGGALFSALAQIGADADASQSGGDLPAMLTRQASKSFEQHDDDVGDLMLMMALTVVLIRDEPIDQATIDVAEQHQRPVHVPLLMHGAANKKQGDPAGLAEAMRAAVEAACGAPDPEAVLIVRRATHDFRRGERAKALEALSKMLRDAERDGLSVPRQIFRFEQQSGNKTFNAEQSHSYGSNLLKGAGTFQVGLGMQTGGKQGGRMIVRFAPDDASARSEAARYYAHAAAVTASYHFAGGDSEQAIAFARRAIATYAHGVLLGRARVPSEGKASEWTADASGVLAIAAQQAADRGYPFLAGDLWTLAKASLEPTLGDEQVADLLEPLPLPLRGVPEIDAMKKRAAKSLELLAAALPCTTRPGDPAALDRVRCDAYPTALGLRVADAMPVLPRLKKGAEIGKPACAAWRQLDTFLGKAGSGVYEPADFMSALTALRARHVHAAATLLARHRHPNHCSPDIAAAGRALSTRRELHTHLRADLLSVAANCATENDEIAADLNALDDLTQRHANPTRNFEVLLFAVRHALTKGQWRPLYQISSKPGFVKRWHELGPDIASAALLIHHAAALGAEEAIDVKTTAPFHRLLCTTFPTEGTHGALCNTVTLLRGDKPAAEKKRAASEALATFVQSITQRQ